MLLWNSLKNADIGSMTFIFFASVL